MKIKLQKQLQNIVKLPFSCQNKNGDVITVDSMSIKKNTKSILPICAEFQYSRYSESEWEKGLRKIKASGADMVASYVFWIHHEEDRGVFRFDGCRNIRKFVQLCQKVGLTFFLRIGPWVTGECKNGGFPDWVVDLPDVKGKVHGNTSEYKKAVRTYLEKYYEQISDLFWKDGGPIIGVQLENEYTIHRSFSIEDGEAYMVWLKETLIEIGYIVPFYTRTAWGKAINTGDELLPMYGAYCDAPWSPALTEDVAKRRFLMMDEKQVDALGFGVEANLTLEDIKNTRAEQDAILYEKFIALSPSPLLTTELGGGMQPSKRRRVVCEKDDNEALTICMLGRGCNFLGYYIFHGGTHPNGVHDYMQSTANGVMANDYPKKSYDFGACISESTKLRDSYHALKSRFMMIKEVEELLPLCETIYPSDNTKNEDDFINPRYAIRYDSNSGAGFIFCSNHVRKAYMPMKELDLTLETCLGEVEVPKIRLANHQMKIIPFNLPLGNAKLISTNAQFLTRINDAYFFFTNEKPIYNIDGNAKIITISDDEAYYSYKFGNKLYISPEVMYEVNGKIYLETTHNNLEVITYDENGKKEKLSLSRETVSQNFDFKLTGDNNGEKTYEIDMSKLSTQSVEDIIMTTDFIGDRAEIYDETGELISDWFTTGEDYQISLKRFGYTKKITLKVFESEEVGTVYYDMPVRYGCELNDIKLESSYKFEIK